MPLIDRIVDLETARAFCAEARADLQVLGYGAWDRPLWAAVRAGDPDVPPVLVTAGAHADETSGPDAALRLLAEEEARPTLVVVPFRDPLGWGGIADALRERWGVPTRGIRSWDEVRQLLAERADVLVEDGSFMLADIGETFIAGVRATPDSFGSEKTVKILQYWVHHEPGLLQRLAWQHILIPANAPECDQRGVLERAYSMFFAEDGFVGHYNRFFGHPAGPAEVRIIQQLIDELKPGLTIDLHEGWNDRTYWFVPSRSHTRATISDQLEEAVCKALDREVLPTSSLSELVPNMPLEHLDRFTPYSHGRLEWSWTSPEESIWGVALMPYALRHGVAYQSEVGRWNDFATRVRYQQVLSSTLIRAYTH